MNWFENVNLKDSTLYENGFMVKLRCNFESGRLRYRANVFYPHSFKCKEAVYFDATGKRCGEIKNGNGTFIVWSEGTADRWLKTHKNGEEVAS